ncbi:MAG: Crp/Fnr family transcriptional regulator [Firmicutes bacterium]|nr:Crp/Fnr family transcriptional regulator [Bacillota bacterium]
METNRRLCLWDLPLFDGVELGIFSPVCREAAHKKHYRRGDVIFNQGDASDTLYLIKDGSFKLVRVNEDGKEVILQVACKGEVLGETALFRESAHPVTAIALEDARVCSLNRRRLEEVIRASPDLAMQVIFSLGNRLYSTWEQVTELRTGSTRERVLNLLIRLAGEHGEPCSQGTIINVHLTQQDIADFVGVSRVMAARAIKELVNTNHVKRHNKYYVLKDRCF